MTALLLTLDTTAPTLTVEAPSHVEPPDDLVVVVTASEPLGPVSLALVDALGSLTQLGHEMLTPSSFRVSVPTMALATGQAELLISAADEVLNIARRSVFITIDRPRAFDVVLTFERGHDVDFTTDDAFEVVAEVLPAFEVEVSMW